MILSLYRNDEALEFPEQCCLHVTKLTWNNPHIQRLKFLRITSS